jgi:hypothetical protein
MAEPNIPEPLLPHVIPIDSVKPWPGNPNVGDIDDVADSLKRYGQWRPAVVQKSTMQVVIGNTMWIGAKEHLGWDSIAAIVLDIDDLKAREMLSRDNRSRDKATYNDFLLKDFLDELIELSGGDVEIALDGTGWESTDFDELLKTTGTMAADTTEFLEQFTAAPVDAPSLNPFSDAPAPASQTPPPPSASPAVPHIPTQAQPAGTGAFQPASGGDVEAAPHGDTAAYGPGVHTGPAAYDGPGAPSPAGNGPDLPQRPDLTPVQWVVTVDQRETIRAAIRTAQNREQLDNASAALTAVCAHYLTSTTLDTTAQEDAADS